MRPLNHQYCIYCDNYIDVGEEQLCRSSLSIDGVSGEKLYLDCVQARGSEWCDFSTKIQEHELREIEKDLEELEEKRTGILNSIRWRCNYGMPVFTALVLSLTLTVIVGLVSNSIETMAIVGLSSVFVSLVIAVGICSLTYYWEQFPTQTNIQFLKRRQIDLREKINLAAENRGVSHVPEEWTRQFNTYIQMNNSFDCGRSGSFPQCISDAFDGPEGNKQEKVDEFLLVCSCDNGEGEEPIVPLSVAQEALRLERQSRETVEMT